MAATESWGNLEDAAPDTFGKTEVEETDFMGRLSVRETIERARSTGQSILPFNVVRHGLPLCGGGTFHSSSNDTHVESWSLCFIVIPTRSKSRRLESPSIMRCTD